MSEMEERVRLKRKKALELIDEVNQLVMEHDEDSLVVIMPAIFKSCDDSEK